MEEGVITINSRNNYFDFMCTVLSALLLIAMYIFPDTVREAASDGIKICLTKAIPSLMPYIIATKIFSSYLLKLEKTELSHFNVGANFGVMLLGLVSGFPNGALLTADLYKSRAISKERAEILISCSNCISPAFCISVFGSDLLNGRIYGFITFTSMITVNISLYIIQSRYANKDNSRFEVDERFKSNLCVISSSITDGMMTVINICAFVVFFMCFADTVQVIMRLVGLENSKITAIVNSLIEITGGIEKLKKLKYGTRFIVGNAVMGFGGLSAIMQVVSVCNGAGLSVKRFLGVKIISILAVPLVSFFILLSLPANTLETESFSLNMASYTNIKQLIMLIAFLLISAVITVFVIKRRKDYKKSKIFL